MRLEEFDAKFAGLKQSDRVTLSCDHPEHPPGEEVTLGREAARRNIAKNGGEAFICRKCFMSHSNPMTMLGSDWNSGELIDVHCDHPDHKGDRVRQIQKVAYRGKREEPYTQTCKSCAQFGKEISQEQREKISKGLTGKVASDQKRQKLSDHMKNHPERIEMAKKNFRPELGRGWNKGQKTPPEVIEKISRANTGQKRSEEVCKKMSESRKKMLEEQGGFTKEHRANISKAVVKMYKNGFNPNSFHVKGWHSSPKAGDIPFRSSYEKKAFLKLDADPEVESYVYEPVDIEYFDPVSEVNRLYIVDLEVKMVDGTRKFVEVKPLNRIEQVPVATKLAAGRKYADEMGVEFEVWSEPELFGSAVYNPKIIQQFTDSLRNETNPEQDEIRWQKYRERTKRYYDKNIANDNIQVWCDFCQEDHIILAISHRKNVKKNGRYICIKENGVMIGSLPNKHKNPFLNPYAPVGKKKCTFCEEIKLLEEFGTDKGRADGRANRCKECRAKINKEKYQENKKPKEET